ncbi:MAG TPA: hypothetical protein VK675_04890 [Candidatus Paceibacterota bacterium]|nr:hypothetical protein [Candidatus Paceibacterota bacterium]
MKIIRKDKNTLRFGSKSKILVLGLMLFVLAILLGPVTGTSAQENVLGPCTVTDASRKAVTTTTTKADCYAKRIQGTNSVTWTSTGATAYQLLAPLPCEKNTPGCDANGQLKTFDAAQSNTALGAYLNLMIKVFIGICAVLSVVMIVIGGLEYMTSELISSKEHGKERIRNALLGLLIALGSYALLFTINPDLLNSEPKIDTASVPAPPAPPATYVGDDGKPHPLNGTQQGSGNYCAVVLVHLSTPRGQAPKTATNELCKPTMAECLTEISYYGGAGSSGVLRSCYLKSS